ncbi:hypothetical protein BGX24_009659 [Mortierella sp. AD032]|nr:hypothetical protein BGX24_009659 [Mortierella sp. AD032]
MTERNAVELHRGREGQEDELTARSPQDMHHRNLGFGSALHQHVDDGMVKESVRQHRRNRLPMQREDIGREGRDEEEEEGEERGGGRDVLLSQREVTQTSTNNQVSGVTEEGHKKKVSLGSFEAAPESNVKKISRSLSVDMEFYPLGRRHARGLAASPRQFEVVTGEGSASKPQSNHEALDTGRDDDRRGPLEVMDVDGPNQVGRNSPSAGVSSNGIRNYPAVGPRGYASINNDAAPEHPSEPQQHSTEANGSPFVLGQEGYYTKSNLYALYARWEVEYQSARRLRYTNSMEPEDGESSRATTFSKGKARKQEKLRDVQRRKGSKSSIQDELEDEDEGDEDVDDDEDDSEEGEDEEKGEGRAESFSGSLKRKRLGNGKGKGKGKGKAESESKKRKKLKSTEDTRKHPCSTCGKRFSRPSQRDTHFLTHTGQFIVQCRQ